MIFPYFHSEIAGIWGWNFPFPDSQLLGVTSYCDIPMKYPHDIPTSSWSYYITNNPQNILIEPLYIYIYSWLNSL